jgi:hypothetical protein
VKSAPSPRKGFSRLPAECQADAKGGQKRMQISTIYLVGEGGKNQHLAHIYLDDETRKRLLDDFISFQNTGTPKAGSYDGRNAEVNGGQRPMTVALRFDLVAAIR